MSSLTQPAGVRPYPVTITRDPAVWTYDRALAAVLERITR